MDFHPLLAEETPARIADKLFQAYPAAVAIPVFVVAMIVIEVVFERVFVFAARRLSAQTETKVDDALVAGLPSILRPGFVLIGLHVLVNVLLRVEAKEGGTKLDPTGEVVSRVLVVVTTLVLAGCVLRVVMRMIDAWAAAEPTRKAIAPSLKFGVKLIAAPLAVLLAAEFGGAEISSFLAALSVGSLAIGLALQDTLKNMIAGIQIVLDRPIRAGDFVEVEGKTRGTVTEIGLRSTKLRSVDNNTVIIPNSTIANAMVVNFDVQDRSYIETFLVSVAYGSDTRRVQGLLEEVAAAAQKELSSSITDEPIKAIVKGLGESSVDFTVPVKFRQFTGRAALATELYHRFYERLRGEGIEIPYPTRTVYLRDERRPAAEPTPTS